MKFAWAAASAVMLGLALQGCATPSQTSPAAPACAEGQEPMRLAQLFFGRHVAGDEVVSEDAFEAFLNAEITPRFPAGLTVLDGGGQWSGSENKLIREASKVVIIVMPPGRGGRARIDEVRDAYKARFGQKSVLLVTQQACVSF